MDSVDWGALFAGDRRHQLVVGDADDATGHAGDLLVVERDPDAHQGVLHPAAAVADRHAGRIHVAGLFSVLRFLGSDAGADVFSDWRVGQRPAAVCGDQVFSVHAGGLGDHAAGDSGALFQCDAADRSADV